MFYSSLLQKGFIALWNLAPGKIYQTLSSGRWYSNGLVHRLSSLLKEGKRVRQVRSVSLIGNPPFHCPNQTDSLSPNMPLDEFPLQQIWQSPVGDRGPCLVQDSGLSQLLNTGPFNWANTGPSLLSSFLVAPCPSKHLLVIYPRPESLIPAVEK